MERREKRTDVGRLLRTGVWAVMGVVALWAIVTGATWHWMTLVMCVGMGLVSWYCEW